MLIRLRPDDPAASLLSLVCGTALFDAVAAAAPATGLSLKWPNDLLLGGAKLGGILIERSSDRVVAGFGVNLARAPSVDRPAAALSPLVSITPQAFAPLLAGALDRSLGRWRDDPKSVAAAWLDRAHPLGTALTVHGGPRATLSGSFAGLDAGGALMLRLADGTTRVIHAGDASLG